MTNRSRLVSGRVPTSNSANVTSDRYQFLDLSSAEPNLGTANAGYILSYDTNFPGGRKWIDPAVIVSGNTQVIFDAANAAYAFAQTSFNKANSANVLAQSAYNQANLANSLAQSAYDKSNSANVLAQAAFDNSNTKFSSSGGNISGDVVIINNKNLTVTGNLTVQGNLISTNTQQFSVADPLILLGLGNYTSDLKDIGFASHYNDGTNAHTGLIRDAGTKEYIFFQGYTPELDANNELNIANPSFATANVVATYFKGNLVGRTAVVNNIELGGFTASAYNQANTAVNSTIILTAVNAAQNANISIALAGLSAANANIIALQAGLNAANSNISFLTGFSQGAYDKANSANALAQAAFDAANSGSSAAQAFAKANSANVLAQAAYNQANSASSNTIVLAAINISQNANIAIALAGVASANANILALQTRTDAAYNSANTAQLSALNAFGFAQGAYNQANSAYGIALSAGIQANVANSIANTALQNTSSIVTSGNLTVSNNLTVTNNVTAAYITTTGTGGSISGANTISANTLNVLNAIITSNTASVSNLTGALTVTGGVGVAGNLYATAVYSNNKIVLTSEPIGQGAYDKANAANVLAQAAYDFANTSAGNQAYTQAAFNKANVAASTANTAVQSSGGTITGTLNVANIIETGKTITVAANTSWNTNAQLANSGIVVGALTYKSNSIYFDGASDSLTLSPGVAIGANPYTVEFWMYLLDTNITSALGVIGTNTTNAFNLRLNSNTQIQIDKSFSGYQLFNIPTLQANTWYHVATVRDVSNRETVFINGVRSSTGFVTDNSNFSGPTNQIAADVTTANYTPYLSNIRIVTNNNLYDPTQSSVTVPTGVLGTVTGTQYLGAQYGASYDASGTQAITVNGAARALLFSPFYNQPAISLLFDGANNWLTYGGITANNFYSNNLNVLGYAQAAFDAANSAISGTGSGYLQGAYDKANSANVLAQSAYNQANTASGNTVVLSAITVAQNANISIALAGVLAANANISIALAGVIAANANIVSLQAGLNATNTNTAIALAGVLAANANIVALQAGLNATNTNTAIALAGVAAANSNISFLTGFSQGAYNTVNTTATVANSTAVVANIVAAGLVATNTNTAIALAGVAAANSNISFLTGFSQGAYDKANAANVMAQAAYDNSNTKFNSSGGNITGDVNIINNKNLLVTGNLTVLGNLVTTNTQSFTVADPLILLGTGNYYTDISDIGFASHYNDGINAHTGFIRDAGTKDWYLFKGYTPELDANNNLVITDPSFRTDNLVASIVKANLFGTTAIVNNIELGGFTSSAYDKANAANVLAQASYNYANSLSSGITSFTQGAYDKANVATAGVVAANANISFLTGFSQGAYNKANAALPNTGSLITVNSVSQVYISNTSQTALTIAGGASITGNLTTSYITTSGNVNPSIDNTYYLGQPGQRWHSLYVGPGSVDIDGIVLSNTGSGGALQISNASDIFFVPISGQAPLPSFSYAANTANSAQANTIAIQGVDRYQNNLIGIVQGGLNTANANISFLTGFSQGAYDKANTTATVANSTAVVANIVAAGLVATNTNTAIALAGVQAANANISFLTGFSQGAYDKANAAYNYANTLSGSISTFSQGAYDKANAANVLAQSAFDNSNTKFSSSGGNINGDVNIINGKNLVVSGNLTVQGNLVTTNTQSFTVADPLILLGLGNYTTDLKDIGFVSHYNDGVNAHAGFFRDFGTKEWYLFKGYTPEVDAINDININDASFKTANLNADIVRGNLIGTTAVVNNIELGGFTAAAYGAANVVASGLVAANANITFLTGFSQGAYNKANSANVLAQAAYDAANLAINGTGSGYVQAAFDKANSANSLAQSAYNKANTTATVANTALQNTTSIVTAGNLFVSNNLTVTNNITAAFIGTTGVGGGSISGANTISSNTITVIDAFVTGNLTIGGTNVINSLTLANSSISFLTGFSQGAYDKANVVAAGVSAANANISFLTGFSQGSYDKANTTATVANSTAVIANIVTAALVSTNTNVAIALAGVSAANSNISFLTGFSQNAFNKANAAYDYANTLSGSISTFSQGAYDKANTTATVANSTAVVANIVAAGLVATNTNTAIALAGVAAANANINFLTGFSQGAYDKANIVTAGLVATNTNTAIALAGVSAANSNINFLTGFSQSAYDKANTTATVANSTAVVANIVAAGLVSTNTNTAIALAGVTAANSNISFLTGFSQGAYNQANAANVLAQAAYDSSNTKFSSSGGNISGDVTIINNKNLVVTGNLTVQGNLVSTNTQSFTVADPLILLGLGNYTSDVLDIGFVSHYNDGVNAHAGFFRDSTTKDWYVFKGYTPEVDANNNIDITNPSFKTANINADIVRANLVTSNVTFGFGSGGSITFPDGTVQSTAAGSSALDQTARNTANQALGISQSTAIVANSTAVVANIALSVLPSMNTNTAIALAGISAANANIALSLGAYGAVNATAIIANSTAVVANIALGVLPSMNANISIALAGVLAANSNINFLTGFSQGAYDKANAAYNYANTISGGSAADSYARIVANSTAIVANIVAAGLVSTNTNTAIALAGVLAANSNISFLTGFSQGAYNQANSANALAQYAADKANAAYNYANTISGGSSADSYARIVANSTAIVANIVAAGLVSTNTNTAIALAGVAAANSNISFLTGFSQGAYNKANTTATVANTALQNTTSIVTAGDLIVTGNLIVSNTSFLNSLTSANANIALLFAIDNYQNTAIQTAFDKANSANILAQAAFDKANNAASANASSPISGWTPNAVIFANSGGYLSNTTGFQFYSTNNSHRVAGTLYVNGETGKSALIANGYNQRGGTGYQGFLEVTNEYSSATTPSKFFRLDQSGSIQIRNSGDTQTIFQLTDGGEVTIPSALKSNFIQFGDGSQQWTANAGGSSGLAQAAYDKANSANVLAQAAYNQANTGGGSGLTVTTANTPPASGNVAGAQWYNTTNDTLYEYTTTDGVYYYWIDITSPTAASTNASTVTGVSAGKAIAYALIFGG